ncbi:MAG: hypothetical protein K1000chlam2_00832 [Chlamydiae bacterium]|nr:hypothetical protein [Chlamydiota bacterium]
MPRMVDRINSLPFKVSSFESFKSSPLLVQRYVSTIVSAKESTIGNVFWTIVSPIIWFFEWLGSKLAPTTKELELFEKLLEGAFWGGAAYFYKRSMGEERLRAVVASCEDLCKRLREKWFPNIEKILFMRRNLVKIKMRAYAALGEENKVKISRQELKDTGIEVSNEIEQQTHYLLVATKPKFRFVLRVVNRLVQLSFKAVSKFF